MPTPKMAPSPGPYARIVTRLWSEDSVWLWPNMEPGWVRGAEYEVYVGDAHLDASDHGIGTCFNRPEHVPFEDKLDCSACAVDQGLALMVRWDRDLLFEDRGDQMRALSLAKCRASVRRAQAERAEREAETKPVVDMTPLVRHMRERIDALEEQVDALEERVEYLKEHRAVLQEHLQQRSAHISELEARNLDLEVKVRQYEREVCLEPDNCPNSETGMPCNACWATGKSCLGCQIQACEVEGNTATPCTCPDWEALGENVHGHCVLPMPAPHEDGRACSYHHRLDAWTFDNDKKCLREHPDMLTLMTRKEA